MSTTKKDDALTKASETSLARPSFIEDSGAGTEDITADDLRLPRLAIAQGLSAQLIPDDATYIKGLGMFDLFNDLTSEIYGRGPLQFAVARRDTRRIEFDPNDRKVVLDLDVPVNDKRNLWTKDDAGKGVRPAATKFVEFIILLLHPERAPEPIVMSIKETNKFNKRTIERLTGFIKLRQPPAPIYAGLYTVGVGTEKNDKGTFGVYTINNAGFIQDPDVYSYAKAFHLSLGNKKVETTREAGADDFDTTGMDAEAGASGM